MRNKHHQFKTEKNRVIGLYDVHDYNTHDWNCIIPPFYNGEEITVIGERAFDSYYYLKSIILSDSITDIEEEAFYLCEELESIKFGSNLKHIGDYAFMCCSSLKSITLPDSLESIGDEAFNKCSALSSVTLGKNISSIGLNAFARCSKLENISVSGENEYFSSRDGILYNKEGTEIVIYPAGRKGSKFVIPDGVTSIGKGCFSANKSLR